MHMTVFVRGKLMRGNALSDVTFRLSGDMQKVGNLLAVEVTCFGPPLRLKRFIASDMFSFDKSGHRVYVEGYEG